MTPREVFSPAGRDFPSALVRFLLCLGVQPSAVWLQKEWEGCYGREGLPLVQLRRLLQTGGR
jgi:hypothetical protein